MDALDAARIFGSPGGRVVGCEGEVLQVVESTMDMARRRIASGAPDGYVVLAEKQRLGRGRRGTWECAARRGILMSVVLRLGVSSRQRRLIALMGAVAGAEALALFGARASIKWPNDIVVAQKRPALRIRKLGGVLVEQHQRGDSAPVHILGIGINVNQDRRQLPVNTPVPGTSLKIELGGRETDRNELCVRLLERLDFWYGKLGMGQPEALLARWRTLSCLLGETVRARLDGQAVEGRVLGLRASGELILQRRDGEPILLTGERAVLLFGGKS